jgi:diguanylate cyclase (GGDEF)-like protein
MSNDLVTLRARALSASALAEIVATQNAIAGAGMHLGEIMRIVAERAERMTHAVAAVVEVPEGDGMIYRAATGDAAAHVGLRVGAASPAVRCLRTGQVLRCSDADVDDRVDREVCRRVGARSLILVPLVHEHARVGVLEVMSPEPNAFDDEEAMMALQVMAGLAASAMHYAELWDEKELALAEVRRISMRNAALALTDALTGLGNRRAGEEALVREMSRAQRAGTSLTLLLIDVDHFKRINDEHGHHTGDHVLRAVASTIAAAARASDLAFRWGGEEFLVLLANAHLRGALECAERIRSHVAALDVDGLHVTVSIGAAELERGEPIDVAMRRADEKLFVAKSAGRNCTRS